MQARRTRRARRAMGDFQATRVTGLDKLRLDVCFCGSKALATAANQSATQHAAACITRGITKNPFRLQQEMRPAASPARSGADRGAHGKPVSAWKAANWIYHLALSPPAPPTPYLQAQAEAARPAKPAQLRFLHTMPGPAAHGGGWTVLIQPLQTEWVEQTAEVLVDSYFDTLGHQQYE